MEFPERLLPIDRSIAPLYAPGRWIVFTKDPRDLSVGYAREDIRIQEAPVPPLTERMRHVWEARHRAQFPHGVRRAGKFVGMHHPLSTEGSLILPVFPSGFLDWKLTLPWGDSFDGLLEMKSLRIPLNIHHVTIAADGHLLYAVRGSTRETWTGAILGTHSWGDDVDKDPDCGRIYPSLVEGGGDALYDQALRGIMREFNPYEFSSDAAAPNRLLQAILNRENLAIDAATCLTLHLKPSDVSYHVCFVARTTLSSRELLDRRRQYPFGGRIASFHAVPFTRESMAAFFRQHHERMATTVEPAIVMACVRAFGEGFLSDLPYPVLVRGKQVS